MNSEFWWEFFYFVCRSLKVIVRWITGTHELQRILASNFKNEMAYHLVQCIQRSHQLSSIRPALKSPSLNINHIYHEILRIKKITKTQSHLHQTYIEPNLKLCLQMIKNFNQVIRDMNERVIPFTIHNGNHIKLLKNLWRSMNPLTVYHSLENPVQELGFNVPSIANEVNENKNEDKNENEHKFNADSIWTPAIIHPAWELIGFQSSKPAQDFRGMGIFSIDQMSFFSHHFSSYSSAILKYCMTIGPLHCFSYAITGIAMSADILRFFNSRKCEKFFYLHLFHGRCVDDYQCRMNTLHILYCIAYVRFAKLWKEIQPPTIMEYQRVHSRFLEQFQYDFVNDKVKLLSKSDAASFQL